MTTLVTGATGFVGAAVARALLEAQHRVRVLCREQSDRRNIDGLPVEVCLGDLRDPESLEAALDGCDTLFHVAADYRLWTRHPRELYESNVKGTLNMMQAARRMGTKRIVYTSSVATIRLGQDNTPVDEESVATVEHMVGHYKRSKFLAEKEVMRLAREEGLPVVVVNPSTPIGPRDVKPTPTGQVIVEAVSDRMPAYVDTGLNVVHVDDVAHGHLLALAHGTVGERYILGGDNLTLREILYMIADMTGAKPPRVRLPHNAVLPIAFVMELLARCSRNAQPRATVDGVKMSKHWMFFSSTKAERELGYTHRPALDALHDAWKWFCDNGYVVKKHGKKQYARA